MGDFERTYGAGANLDSIINGYDRDLERRFEPFDTKKIDFLSYSWALAFAKDNPGSVVARSAEAIAGGGDRFSVTPSGENEYFQFTQLVSERYVCSAAPEEFMISVPKNVEVSAGIEVPKWAWEDFIKEGLSSESVENRVVAHFGNCKFQVIQRKPFTTDVIISNLNEADMALAPASENVCFIVSDVRGQCLVQAVLVTNDGVTTLIHRRYSGDVYSMLA